jgi:hypothetical protein
MPRLLVAVALTLTLVGCSSTTTATLTPLPLTELVPQSGVDLVAARQALIDFLNGYANASQDDGKTLEHLLGSGPPELKDWVHWLVVQNRSNPGVLTGTTHISGIQFQGFATILGQIPGAKLRLDAQVTLTYRPPNAAPVTLTHDFTGDATVFQLGTGDWRVYDVTRDGQSMDSAIHLVNNVSLSSHGVTVDVRSLWTLAPFLSFNVTVANRGPSDITFDAGATALTGASQADFMTSKSHTAGLDRIPAGGTGAGTINFGAPSPTTQDLVIAFSAAGEAGVQLSVSLNRLANAIVPARPPTAASPTPSAGA